MMLHGILDFYFWTDSPVPEETKSGGKTLAPVAFGAEQSFVLHECHLNTRSVSLGVVARKCYAVVPKMPLGLGGSGNDISYEPDLRESTIHNKL